MPKVSVIVTSYNIERYIAESLRCITSQTLQDIEIIVVDDGSSDGTPQIIREFAERDSRIRPILFSENTIGGVATAANAGMDAATGDFIGFADGDDRYAPEMFEKLWRAATDANADLAMCRYMLLDESDGRLKEPAEVDRWRNYTSVTSLDMTQQVRCEMLRFISVPWRKLYRRDLVERSGLRFPVGDFFFEDNPFHWASVIDAERIVLVPERLCDHRVARAGQTMATVDERLLRIFMHHDIIRDWLARTGNMELYRPELLQWVAGQLSWVSQRAQGDVRRALFDIMVPIAAQYDTNAVDEFTRVNGPGRTSQMLTALQAGDFGQFSKAAGWNAPAPQSAGQVSLVGRGFYHLRHSGVRQTAMMTATYVASRFGRPRKAAAAPVVQNNGDLMFALAVLQREIQDLRKEVRDLSRKLQD